MLGVCVCVCLLYVCIVKMKDVCVYISAYEVNCVLCIYMCHVGGVHVKTKCVCLFLSVSGLFVCAFVCELKWICVCMCMRVHKCVYGTFSHERQHSEL